MKKLLLFLLILSMVFCAIPFTASAAEAGVNEIDGERVVFLSSFGKMSYNKVSYTAFKTLGDALSALGTDGGKIMIAGKYNLTEFSDIKGRGPVTIEGQGTKPTGNLINFAGTAEAPLGNINLEGDLVLTNITIRLAKDAYLLTNGHSVNGYAGFDTYSVLKSGVTTYEDPPSIATASAEKPSAVTLSGGVYTNLVAGAVEGKTVNGNTAITLSEGTADYVVAGNISGTTNGNSSVVLGNVKVKKLVAGPSDGKVAGSVMVDLGTGIVDELIIGPESGASVDGSLVLVANGVTAKNVTKGAGKISGKTVVVLTPDSDISLDGIKFDYTINMENGVCIPVFDGSEISGFTITDEYGIPANAISVNGTEVMGDLGVFTIPEGESNVSILNKVKVEINRNATYVAGYEDGSFAPQNNMTRAEAITLLSRLVVDENAIKGKLSSEYIDVADGVWYDSYIAFFEKLGILETLEEQLGSIINPSDTITRGEFAELIYQISRLGDSTSSMKLKNFSDVDKNHKFVAAISYAVEEGIVTGYDDGTFKPENLITRAEVVTMANRFVGRVPSGNEGANTFNDISGHWAKSQILAACNAENETWTAKGEDPVYQITGTSAEDYVVALYDQSKNLSAQAIRDGVDVISEQMKKDILGTGNTIEYYPERMTGKTYYISEKNGNDENDGLSPETAWQTLAAIKKVIFPKAGTSILFERGGIYRGTVAMSNHITYGAYGEGEKPLIMQSEKNYADELLWLETEWENVWECTDLLTNVGIIGFDHDLYDYSEASYNETYGLIMNKGSFGFQTPADLNGDLQFYSDVSAGLAKPGKLYLYCEGGNPGKRFSSIEIGEKINTFSGAITNVVIDNLAMKFTGAHAIGFGNCKNVTVTNCVFSWLGGSVLSYTKADGSATNYGNAVQVYGACDGYYVKNNWMYQIYDTAVTHQRSASVGDCIQKDVEYISNLMEYVYWGIEFYNAPPTAEQLNGKKDTYKRITENVRSAYNVLRLGGYGWGSIVRYRGAQLYCGATLSDNRNNVMEYNIVDRAYGNILSNPANSTELEDKNIYIQTIGQGLGRLKGSTTTCSYDAAKDIEKLWGDKNAVVIVIDPEKEPVVLNKPKGLAKI